MCPLGLAGGVVRAGRRRLERAAVVRHAGLHPPARPPGRGPWRLRPRGGGGAADLRDRSLIERFTSSARSWSARGTCTASRVAEVAFSSPRSSAWRARKGLAAIELVLDRLHEPDARDLHQIVHALAGTLEAPDQLGASGGRGWRAPRAPRGRRRGGSARAGAAPPGGVPTRAQSGGRRSPRWVYDLSWPAPCRPRLAVDLPKTVHAPLQRNPCHKCAGSLGRALRREAAGPRGTADDSSAPGTRS